MYWKLKLWYLEDITTNCGSLQCEPGKRKPLYMSINKVCILGGTGFVGSHLTCRMNSYGIRQNSHPPSPAPSGINGGWTCGLINTNPFDRHQLEAVMDGCDAAVNLVGILNETHAGKDFQHIHGAGRPGRGGLQGIGRHRLLHMSALNANESNGPPYT